MQKIWECNFIIHDIKPNLPQQAGRRRTSLFPTFLARVVALYKSDNGNDSHFWLSGIQKRALWTSWQSSTKHLIQLSGNNPPVIFIVSHNFFLQVPQPLCEIIIVPDMETVFSSPWTSEVDVYGSFFGQLGQPITPKTISPLTTRANPTWKCNPHD